MKCSHIRASHCIAHIFWSVFLKRIPWPLSTVTYELFFFPLMFSLERMLLKMTFWPTLPDYIPTLYHICTDSHLAIAETMSVTVIWKGSVRLDTNLTQNQWGHPGNKRNKLTHVPAAQEFHFFSHTCYSHTTIDNLKYTQKSHLILRSIVNYTNILWLEYCFEVYTWSEWVHGWIKGRFGYVISIKACSFFMSLLRGTWSLNCWIC